MRTKKQWIESIDVDVEPRLLVGWRPARRKLTGETVDLHQDTYAELRSVVTSALTSLSGMEAMPYGDAALPSLGEEYMSRNLSDLPTKRRASDSSASLDSPTSHPIGDQKGPRELDGDSSAPPPTYDGEHSDEASQVADVLELIDNLDDLPVLSAGRLRDGSFAFYAICFPQANGETIACIRGISPTRVLNRAAFFGRHQGSLRKVERPDLLLEGAVDLVITGDEVAILRRSTYDRLFADLDELATVVPKDVAALQAALPSLPLAPGSAATLEALCARLPSMAKRLHRLVARADLIGLTDDVLRTALEKHGENPSHWLDQSGSVTLTEDRAKQFLDVMEERWWTTDFTQERRRADAFRSR